MEKYQLNLEKDRKAISLYASYEMMKNGIRLEA